MKIGVLGLGKLGLPVALAIESRGHDIFAYDVNPATKSYLDDAAIPYREVGIQPLLEAHNITWCESAAQAIANTDIVFIAVQTPHQPEYEGTTRIPDERSDFDYTHLLAAIQTAADACAALRKPTTVAVISTCLPGTFRTQIQPALNEYTRYVYTPQFIAMGTVLTDYLNPEFNLIGVHDTDAADQLRAFYGTINKAPCICTDITTAEGVKVSYNTWITAKTVIANAWGELSERLGMNFDDIHHAWELSTRRLISTRYMDAGMSDGGGCHPRDNIALSWLAQQTGMSHDIWADLMYAREDYEQWHAEIAATTAHAAQLPLIILGRAFKHETGIETGSPAILMANLVAELVTELAIDYHHVDDLDVLPRAVYFIATRNERYRTYNFPEGSVILDPFGYIGDIDGVDVRRLGRSALTPR